MSQREFVLQAIAELIDKRDIGAVDRYWSPAYVEHSLQASGGLDGLRRAASALPDGFRHEKVRLLGDGNLVAVHGIYHGIGPDPLASCDLWRVGDRQTSGARRRGHPSGARSPTARPTHNAPHPRR